MPRQLENWIKGFSFFTSESEAPDSYLFWTAMSTIAGAIQRRVHVRWIYYDFYPNMYIVLVGPPARVHKSSVIAFGRNFLREIGVATASEAITKEALIDQMDKRSTEFASALTVLSSELETFISPSGEKMIGFLTDIFDSPDIWEYTTKGGGTKIIKKPYLNLLAGTTPSWIATSFDISFVEQGMASRTLFIFENKPRFHKAFANITPEMWEMRDKLAMDLEHISQLEGEFEWTEDAIEWFTDWYENHLPQEKLDYRLEGYLGRKPTHLLKVAMVLSLAARDELVLDSQILQLAKAQLDLLESSMVKTFSAVGRNPYASDLERIFNEILLEGGMTKAEIMQRNAHAMQKAVLEETLETLILMGVVRQEVNRGHVTYLPVEEV